MTRSSGFAPLSLQSMIRIAGVLSLALPVAHARAAPAGPTSVRAGLEVAHGDPARTHRTVEYNPTLRASQRSWQHFVRTEPGTWKSLWDGDTGVPLRIFGSGIPAPGALDSPERAEHRARTHLGNHLTLLAPGAKLADFILASNRRVGDLRVVGFTQHHRGIPVLGGQVGFVFKRDRLLVIGSQALPDVRIVSAKASISYELAEKRAQAWVARDFGADARVVSLEAPVIVPLIRPRNGARAADISYAHTLVATVRTTTERGLWQVYVDASTGEPVAREQMLRFGSAQLLYNAPDRWPGGTRSNYPAAYATVEINSVDQTTDSDGNVSWAGTNDATSIVRAQGAFVNVINQAGVNAEGSGPIMNNSAPAWIEETDEYADSQVAIYVHLNIAKGRARVLAPELEWLDDLLVANANINNACNAYFDSGDGTVNFFQSGSIGGLDCGNTGRMADVVYHEFGHGLHFATLVAGMGYFDAAFSEGLSDYFAASITDDPAMGRGFELTDAPLRHIDPDGQEASWPLDVDPDSPHTTGLIFGQAMWDLRKGLIADLGAEQGAAYADELFYAAVQLSSDIPSTYVSMLIADDDDGDLSNGTPNQCIIDTAFLAHGLADPTTTGVGIERPTARGFDISFRISPPTSSACAPMAVASASVSWQVRGNPGLSGVVPMDGIDDEFVGALPPQETGTVVNYRVRVQLENGTDIFFPINEADPMYELFAGYTEEIYCATFEADPFTQGWTSGATTGADDWQWGSPTGWSGDPYGGYTGISALGNNLDGNYAPATVNHVDSPTIDVSGYDNVRLHYRRWLYVEDGYWDRATIYANGATAWQNADSMRGDEDSDVHHTDREWRFHDVDLTPHIQDGNLQLRFELASDQALQFGGWNLDDVCLVTHIPTTCGDGVLEVGEQCDDGNRNSGDGCSSACLLANDELRWVTGGCCDTGGAGTGAPFLWVLVGLVFAVSFRRRRAS